MKNPWLTKLKLPLLILTGLIAIYAAFGYLGVPYLIKSKLPEVIAEQTNQSGKISEVQFDPFSLVLVLKDFELNQPDGETTIGFKELFINFGLWSAIQYQALSFDKLSLIEPYTNIKIDKDGALNLAHLVKPDAEEKPEPPSDEVFPVLLKDFKMVDGQLDFSDLSLEKPYYTNITDLNLAVERLATIELKETSGDQFTLAFGHGGSLHWDGDFDLAPSITSSGTLTLTNLNSEMAWDYLQNLLGFEIKQGALGIKTDYDLKVQGDQTQLEFANITASLTDIFGGGGELKWQGNLKILPNLETAGNIEINNANLPQAWKHLDEIKGDVTGNVRQGSLNLYSDYQFQQGEESFQFTTSNGQLAVKSLDVTEVNSEKSVINVPELMAQGIALDWSAQKLDIQKISSGNGKIAVDINKAGEVNFTRIFTGEHAKEIDQETGQIRPDDQPIRVDIAEVGINDYQVDLVQETEGKPLELEFSSLAINISDFSTLPGHKFNIQTEIAVNKTGHINTKGNMGLDPLEIKLDVNADKLSLLPFQPYLVQSTKLKLTQGSVALDSHLAFSLTGEGKPVLNVNGNASINNLKTVEIRKRKEFLKWKSIDFKKMDFSLEPLKLNVATIDVNGIVTEFIVNKDRSTNLDYIFSGTQEKSTPAKTEKPEKKGKDQPFKLDIGAVNFKDSATFYADSSLILPFAVEIEKLQGSVKKISTDKNKRAEIDLKGKVNNTAPALIKGSVEAFDLTNYLDILMQFKGIDMTVMTPYMAEFAGYKIEKGKLSIDVHYLINNNKLDATNKVVINQLTLGEEVDSPNKVSLPVKLAIGLLKDRHGDIDLDLPLEGSLDDPDFSIFALLGDVMINLLTKVVASPFALIGNIMNTDEDLSRIHFAAGSAVLVEDQKQILTTIAEGLNQRPQLQLEIRGVAYENEDKKGLGEKEIIRQIKAEAWDDMSRSERPEKIMDIQLSDEDYHEILTDLYEDKFRDSAEILIDQAENTEDPAAAKEIYAQMLAKLGSTEQVDQNSLNKLAKKRAKNIMKFVINQNEIDPQRVYIVASTLRQNAEQGEITADLELGVAN